MLRMWALGPRSSGDWSFERALTSPLIVRSASIPVEVVNEYLIPPTRGTDSPMYWEIIEEDSI